MTLSVESVNLSKKFLSPRGTGSVALLTSDSGEGEGGEIIGAEWKKPVNRGREPWFHKMFGRAPMGIRSHAARAHAPGCADGLAPLRARVGGGCVRAQGHARGDQRRPWAHGGTAFPSQARQQGSARKPSREACPRRVSAAHDVPLPGQTRTGRR